MVSSELRATSYEWRGQRTVFRDSRSRGRAHWQLVARNWQLTARRSDQPEIFPGNSREDPIERTRSKMFPNDFPEHRPEVRRQRQVPSLVELFRLEPRPLAVHLSSLHRAADDEQAAGVTVVRATAAVLPGSATELRHREDHDVSHAVSEVGHERVDGLGEVG